MPEVKVKAKCPHFGTCMSQEFSHVVVPLPKTTNPKDPFVVCPDHARNYQDTEEKNGWKVYPLKNKVLDKITVEY